MWAPITLRTHTHAQIRPSRDSMMLPLPNCACSSAQDPTPPSCTLKNWFIKVEFVFFESWLMTCVLLLAIFFQGAREIRTRPQEAKTARRVPVVDASLPSARTTSVASPATTRSRRHFSRNPAASLRGTASRPTPCWPTYTFPRQVGSSRWRPISSKVRMGLLRRHQQLDKTPSITTSPPKTTPPLPKMNW